MVIVKQKKSKFYDLNLKNNFLCLCFLDTVLKPLVPRPQGVLGFFPPEAFPSPPP